MNRRELNSLDMFQTVDLFFEQNKEAFNDFAAITAAGLHIKAVVSGILNLSKTQTQDNKVESGLKKMEKSDLDNTLHKVNVAMNAVAVAESNQELRLLTNISKTELLQAREADYLNRVDATYKNALPLTAKLEKWGVTAADIEKLNTKAASFAGRSSTMRNKTAVTKQASTEIKENVAALNNYLRDDVDALLEPFKALNPTLYGQYKNARKVIDKAATQAKKPDTETEK
jgi:ribosomal protein L12E/L44/L45/RPP1/RPP2